jgi:BirA family transcriptional regulator, biotin operon repressor / biotin---[acetyl-CoA-carboxylase] ligase
VNTHAATELPGPVATRFESILWFDEIDSTNRYLLDRAGSGAPNGLVAVADVQTAGRGRLGRTWLAPPGASLLVSVLLRPTLPIDQWSNLVAPAGLAAVAALTTLCDVPARLKWPNDVVVRDKKIAGLLAEGNHNAVVVGMGLNIDWPTLPPDITETATAVSLVGGRLQSRRVILDAWLRNFDAWLRLLEREPANVSRLRYMQRGVSATIGRRVRVELLDRHVEGIAEDLAIDGRLVVRTATGKVEHFGTGDIVHLRPLSGLG